VLRTAVPFDQSGIHKEPPIFWAESKNEQLRRQHGVGFEEVITALEQGQFTRPSGTSELGSIRTSGTTGIVKIEGYAYVVSYVEDAEKRFGSG